jgi:hypothetical protein
MVMVAEYVLDGAHLAGELAGRAGDAFRTGLQRLFKKRWPVLEAGSHR